MGHHPDLEIGAAPDEHPALFPEQNDVEEVPELVPVQPELELVPVEDDTEMPEEGEPRVIPNQEPFIEPEPDPRLPEEASALFQDLIPEQRENRGLPSTSIQEPGTSFEPGMPSIELENASVLLHTPALRVDQPQVSSVQKLDQPICCSTTAYRRNNPGRYTICLICLNRWCEMHRECPNCLTQFTAPQQIPCIINDDRYRELRSYYIQTVRILLHVYAIFHRVYPRDIVERIHDSAMLIWWIIFHFRAHIFIDMGCPQYCIPRTHPQFRRSIYEWGLWVIPPPSDQKRPISPEYFSDNLHEIDRIRSWLRRELTVLINADLLNELIIDVLYLIQQHPIISRELLTYMEPRLGLNTRHFLHELYCFAASNVDELFFYDNIVTYSLKWGNNFKVILTGSFTLHQVMNIYGPIFERELDTLELFGILIHEDNENSEETTE